MTKKILALIFALLSSACSQKAEVQAPSEQMRAAQNALPDSGAGRLYIDALADAIQKSDRIVVTEHSNIYDVLYGSTQPGNPENYRPIIFTTHELNVRERDDFLAVVKSMATKTQDAETACTFEPHHTITFYRENKQASALIVCFQCGQVEWAGFNKQRPWALVPTLGRLIDRWGMKTERDWRALAKAGA